MLNSGLNNNTIKTAMTVVIQVYIVNIFQREKPKLFKTINSLLDTIVFKLIAEDRIIINGIISLF